MDCIIPNSFHAECVSNRKLILSMWCIEWFQWWAVFPALLWPVYLCIKVSAASLLPGSLSRERRNRTGADNLSEAKQAHCWQMQAVGSTAVTKVFHILQVYWSIVRFALKNSLSVHLWALQQLNYRMGKRVQVFMKWKCMWRRFRSGWLWVLWFKLFWKASWDEHMVHGRTQEGEWSSPQQLMEVQQSLTLEQRTIRSARVPSSLLELESDAVPTVWHCRGRGSAQPEMNSGLIGSLEGNHSRMSWVGVGRHNSPCNRW